MVNSVFFIDMQRGNAAYTQLYADCIRPNPDDSRAVGVFTHFMQLTQRIMSNLEQVSKQIVCSALYFYIACLCFLTIIAHNSPHKADALKAQGGLV